MLTYIPVVASYILLVIATIADIRTKKIPNWLTISVLALGVLYLPLNVPNNVTMSLIALGVLVALFLFRSVGGGDIKLLLALLVWNEGMMILGSVVAGSVLLILWHLVFDWRDAAQRIQMLLRALRTKQMPTFKKDNNPMPFAPFLLSGYTVSVIVYIIKTGGFA